MNYGIPYQPFGYNNFNSQNIQEQIQKNIAELQRLQNNYKQNPQLNGSKANQGLLIPVNDYEEVVNYPTDASGRPYAFICEAKNVMWIKKFIDGSNRIQTYNFYAVNDFKGEPINDTKKSEKSITSENNGELIENLQERMVKLEDTQSQILDLLKGAAKDESVSNNQTVNDK